MFIMFPSPVKDCSAKCPGVATFSGHSIWSENTQNNVSGFVFGVCLGLGLDLSQ